VFLLDKTKNLLDKTKNQIWAPVATGQPVIRRPADRGIVGRAIFGNRIVNVMNAYNENDFSSDVDRATGFRTRTILTIPLVRKRGDPVGALQALNKRGGVFDRADEDMGVLIAEQAAAAVSAALHHDELQSAYRDTIFRLAAAAEFKDYLARHGIALAAEQAPKTKTSLEFFSARLKNEGLVG
jgi:GAF domain-containing protein